MYLLNEGMIIDSVELGIYRKIVIKIEIGFGFGFGNG
jgi:hypothetical protein